MPAPGCQPGTFTSNRRARAVHPSAVVSRPSILARPKPNDEPLSDRSCRGLVGTDLISSGKMNCRENSSQAMQAYGGQLAFPWVQGAAQRHDDCSEKCSRTCKATGRNEFTCDTVLPRFHQAGKLNRGRGKGTSLNSTCLTPNPLASSVYMHVPEAPSPHELSISVMSLFPSADRRGRDRHAERPAPAPCRCRGQGGQACPVREAPGTERRRGARYDTRLRATPGSCICRPSHIGSHRR